MKQHLSPRMLGGQAYSASGSEQDTEEWARLDHPYRGQTPHVGSEAEGEDWEYESRADTPASTGSGYSAPQVRQRSMSVMSVDEPYVPPITPVYVPAPTPGSSQPFDDSSTPAYIPPPTPGASRPFDEAPTPAYVPPPTPGAPLSFNESSSSFSLPAHGVHLFPFTFDDASTPAYIPPPTPGATEPYEDPPTPAFVPPPTPHSAPTWLEPDPALMPPPAPPRRTGVQPATNPNQTKRNLYPAYDSSGRRVGLDPYGGTGTSPPPGASYYRPRTLHYPGPEVSPTDFPHVMSFDMQMNEAPEPRRKRKAVPPSEDVAAQPDRDTTPHAASTSEDQGEFDEEESSPEPETSQTRRRGRPRELPAPDFDDGGPDIPDPEGDLRKLLGFKEDEEVSLNSLVDPPDGEKPGYPYPTLIKLAIYGSPNKRLTLQEIYGALIDRFKWFKEHAEDAAWQVRVNHIVLNNCI